jgi:hypothetical protein
MNRRVYEALATHPKLDRRKIWLQSANGADILVDGSICIHFKIGQIQMQQKFYVVPNLNRNLILGQDWLSNIGVRLYFDLGCMRIRERYIQLENDIHVSTVIRAKRKTVLRPQHATVCMATIQIDPSETSCRLFQITPNTGGGVYWYGARFVSMQHDS